jgi:CRISPR-associated endonuclease/helicase Cas3
MCPAHRRKAIEKLKTALENGMKKCVCISTRLIEAGVDIDFDTAIRFLAGFDSIIQTAGRCNRNGLLKDARGNPISGRTYIINIVTDEEKITPLRELKLGQAVMERILREYHEDEARFNKNLLHPDIIARYFSYFYGQISDSQLQYKVFLGRSDTIVNLLSANAESKSEYDGLMESKKDGERKPLTRFRQSFESAWKEFEVINSDTAAVIVPFEKGENIITELYAGPGQERIEVLLREAQPYSVNIYYNGLPGLLESRAVKRIDTEHEIYAAEKEHYDEHIGLSPDAGRLTMLDA